METMTARAMILLAGEQTAPNLLPARHFRPERVHILHTDFPRSRLMAERLQLRLSSMQTTLAPIEAYDVGVATATISDLLRREPNALINITGGTKPMSLAALAAARTAPSTPFYVRSQQGKTEVDFYRFDHSGAPSVAETIEIDATIQLADHLVAYFGEEYQFTGYGKGGGAAFEEAIHEALAPHVDEIGAGWKHESGAVDVDFVVRCNNQIGIIEAKTGGKAKKTDGIKQLAVAGGQRFFGTYTQRLLVIDQVWSDRSNNRTLANALNIKLVELPGFAHRERLDESEQATLVNAIHAAIGKPAHPSG